MSFIVVIPARFASTRLPGKPLELIENRPMIEHVYRQACKSQASVVVVATDDARIEKVVKAFGGTVCMTATTHSSGTDRLQEVATKLSLKPDDIVVNVQGDEPLIPPEVINQVAENLAKNVQASVATLCEPLNSWDEFQNPNVVKVVRDNKKLALYFSRAAIPWPRDKTIEEEYFTARRHIGLYAYRVALLNNFITWPQAALECEESLEQLRVLAEGEKIHVDDACMQVPGGVDTLQDLERVRRIIQNNKEC